jgi:hypothetical protein
MNEDVKRLRKEKERILLENKTIHESQAVLKKYIKSLEQISSKITDPNKHQEIQYYLREVYAKSRENLDQINYNNEQISCLLIKLMRS